MKSLFKTVFIIFLFTALTRFVGFAFRIYLSREMGAEMLGLYQVSVSVFMVLLTLVASGIPLIISKLTAKGIAQKNNKDCHQTLTSGVVLSLCIATICCIVIVCFSPLIKNIFADPRCMSALLLLLPALIFHSVYSAIRGNLWGKNKYVASCSAEFVEQIIRFVACFFLFSSLFSFSAWAAAAISLTIACFCSMLYSIFLYFKMGGRFSKPKYIKSIFKQSMPITGIRSISSLLVPIISLIIPMQLIKIGYTESQALSLFGIASGMTLPLLSIPLTIIGSLSYALIPDLSTAHTQNNTDYINNRIQTSLTFSLFVGFVMLVPFVGAGQNIGSFFFANTQSGVLLESSAWIIIPWCLTNISSSILNAMGLELKSFKNYIIGAVIMFCCIWFLPKQIGINSLTFAMGLCFAICSFLNLMIIKKHTSKKSSLARNFLLFTLISLPSIALTSFTTNILNFVMPLFFNLAISTSLGVLCFVLLCNIFNVFKIATFVSYLKLNHKTKTTKTKKIHIKNN